MKSLYSNLQDNIIFYRKVWPNIQEQVALKPMQNRR